MESINVKVSNIVCYLSQDLCIFAINYGRTVTWYDAAVLNSLVMQSMFLKSIFRFALGFGSLARNDKLRTDATLEIIDEVLSVLSLKFSREREALSQIAVYLSETAELVHPTERIRIFKDEPDNRIIECALKGKADVVVTGDKEMLIVIDEFVGYLASVAFLPLTFGYVFADLTYTAR